MARVDTDAPPSAPTWPITTGLVGGSEAPAWRDWRSEVSEDAQVTWQRGERGGCYSSERVRALPQQRVNSVAEGELGWELKDGELSFESSHSNLWVYSTIFYPEFLGSSSVCLVGGRRGGLTHCCEEHSSDVGIGLIVFVICGWFSGVALLDVSTTGMKGSRRDSFFLARRTYMFALPSLRPCMQVMLACVSPCDAHYEETLGTLRYAERAKRVRTRAVANARKGMSREGVGSEQAALVER